MGNNGCNIFTGVLYKVNSNHLEFSRLAETKMACPNMELSDEISNSLDQVQIYSLNNLELTLFNSYGTELLKYKKVD